MIAVVAPFVANALVSNAPAGKDFVVPFIAGAMANVAAMNAVNTKAAGPVAGGVGKVGKAVGSGITSRVGAEANFIKDAFRTQPSAAVNSEFSELKSASASTTTSSGPKATTDPAARQARRGAIINQNKNPRAS